MRLPRLVLAAALLLAACRGETRAQSAPDPYDSGGPLDAAQAAYDVTYYALDVAPAPSDSSLAGSVDVHARIAHPTPSLVLDLAPELTAEAVEDLGTGRALDWTRENGRLVVALGRTHQPGETAAVRIRYGGRPRIAPQPPWDGGFTWSTTADGAPWFATSNQKNGADLWWPVKDHVSDEPDSMRIRVRVPAGLVAASNGRLERVRDEDGARVYEWFVSTPINAYDVALNVAPYVELTDTLASVDGQTIIPISFWVLPEDSTRGAAFMSEIKEQLAWFERRIGPYPFRADKYGVVQTPFLGMEHQTIIAYGAGFDNSAMTGTDWGFDALHHHELAHEWWGNQVTNADWKDMWLHEGFGTYMQALYVEDMQGWARGREFIAAHRHQLSNERPVAPRSPTTAHGVYDGDIYYKGMFILDTLRWLMGDEAFFEALRRMSYPEPDADGCACRFADTNDFRRIAEAAAGQDLAWFFDAYVHRPELPRLVVDRDGEELELRWSRAPATFALPVPVEVDGQIRRIEMPGGRARLAAPAGAEVRIDPEGRLLRVR